MKHFHFGVLEEHGMSGFSKTIEAETEEEAIKLLKQDRDYREGMRIELRDVQDWNV